MRILLTNDDGIFAPGIRALTVQLREIGEVFVVAPSLEQSGSSQAITVHQPIRVDEYTMDGLPIKAWSIGGTPADCVKIGLEKLLDERPDFVISGINRGANLGTDVLYSGTVSAAREGAMNGIPSIAVSLDAFQQPDFSAAALFMRQFVLLSAQEPPQGDLLLNVNIPKNWNNNQTNISFTRLGVRKYENAFEPRFDPSGRLYYWMGGHPVAAENAADTDVAVVAGGGVSITPIHFDLTDRRLLRELQSKGSCFSERLKLPRESDR